MIFSTYQSPVGILTLLGDKTGLCEIKFAHGRKPFTPETHWAQNDGAFRETHGQLAAYFNGELKRFELKLSPRGTEFQQNVWMALQKIEYGETSSYGMIAAKLGKPKASRAVGAANGANPLPIVIPCHRVIGANGKLTGFTGGLPTQQWLLAHERGEQSLFPFDEWLPN